MFVPEFAAVHSGGSPRPMTRPSTPSAPTCQRKTTELFCWNAATGRYVASDQPAPGATRQRSGRGREQRATDLRRREHTHGGVPEVAGGFAREGDPAGRKSLRDATEGDQDGMSERQRSIRDDDAPREIEGATAPTTLLMTGAHAATIANSATGVVVKGTASTSLAALKFQSRNHEPKTPAADRRGFRPCTECAQAVHPRSPEPRRTGTPRIPARRRCSRSRPPRRRPGASGRSAATQPVSGPGGRAPLTVTASSHERLTVRVTGSSPWSRAITAWFGASARTAGSRTVFASTLHERPPAAMGTVPVTASSMRSAPATTNG